MSIPLHLDPRYPEYAPEPLRVKVNAIRCDVCRMVIESKSRHDFRTCQCGRVSVDGGHDYQRILWETDGYPTFTIMTRVGEDGPLVEAT